MNFFRLSSTSLSTSFVSPRAINASFVFASSAFLQVILPSDFVVGDIEVDEYGPLPGQRFAGEEDESISNDDCSVETDHGDSGEPEGVSDVGGDSADDDDTSGVAMVNDAQRASIDGPGMLDAGRLGGGVGHDNDSLASAEEEDSEMGFEYDGEVRPRFLSTHWHALQGEHAFLTRPVRVVQGRRTGVCTAELH